MLNDNDERAVTIIIGRVYRHKGGDAEGVHVMLVAPDDDTAVRHGARSADPRGLRRGRARPDRRHGGHARRGAALSAYQGALEGEVSIVLIEEDF